jgi:TatD DNase family protein
MLIDTHCHLNDPAFTDSLPDVLARARAAGIRRFIVPAYDQDSLARTAGLARQYPHEVYPAYGIHPWYVREDTEVKEIWSYL